MHVQVTNRCRCPSSKAKDQQELQKTDQNYEEKKVQEETTDLLQVERNGADPEQGRENKEQEGEGATEDEDGTGIHEDESSYEENGQAGQDERSQHEVDEVEKEDDGDEEEKNKKGRTAFHSLIRKTTKQRKKKKRKESQQVITATTTTIAENTTESSELSTTEAAEATRTTTETTEENFTASPAFYSQASLSAATAVSASTILFLIGGLLCCGDRQIKRPRQVAGDGGEDGRPDQDQIELNDLAGVVATPAERLHGVAAADLVNGAGIYQGSRAAEAAGDRHRVHRGKLSRPTQRPDTKLQLKRAYVSNALLLPEETAEEFNERRNEYFRRLIRLNEERIKMDAIEAFTRASRQRAVRAAELWFEKEKMTRSFPSPSPPGPHPSYPTSTPLSGVFTFPPVWSSSLSPTAAAPTATTTTTRTTCTAATTATKTTCTAATTTEPTATTTTTRTPCTAATTATKPICTAATTPEPPKLLPTPRATRTTLVSPNTMTAASSLASFLTYRRQQQQEEQKKKREAHAAMQGWDVIEEVTERDESSLSSLSTPGTAVPSASSDNVVAVVHAVPEGAAAAVAEEHEADVQEATRAAPAASSATTQIDATRQTKTAGIRAEARKEAAGTVQQEQKRFLSLSDPELYGTIDNVTTSAERQLKSDEGLKRKSQSRFMILRKKLVPQKLFKSATEKEKEQKTQAMLKKWFRSLLGRQNQEPVEETPAQHTPVNPPRRSSSRATLRRRPWVSARNIAPVPWTPLATPISTLSEPCLPMSPLESLQCHYRRGTFGNGAGASPSSPPPKKKNKESKRLSVQELRNLRKLAAQIAKDGAAAQAVRTPVRPIRLAPPPIPPRKRSFSDTVIAATSGTYAAVPETRQTTTVVQAGTGRRTKSAT